MDSESESGVDSESERESCSQGLAGGGGKILDLPSAFLPFGAAVLPFGSRLCCLGRAVLPFGVEVSLSKRF